MSSRNRKLRNAPTTERLVRQPQMSVKQVARIAERVVKSDKLLKYFTINQAPTNVGVTLNLTDLTLIPSGNLQGQRIADTIEIMSLSAIVTVTTANADIFNRTRCNIFTWHELSSTPPNLAALYQTPTSSPGTSTLMNFENRQLYTNYLEKQFVNVGTATNPTNASVIEWKWNHKFRKGYKLAYGLANLQGTNHIFLSAFSDSLAIPFPAMDFRITIWYYDA